MEMAIDFFKSASGVVSAKVVIKDMRILLEIPGQ
jgi:hypothetical protein